jgi:hypothetical protein
MKRPRPLLKWDSTILILIAFAEGYAFLIELASTPIVA